MLREWLESRLTLCPAELSDRGYRYASSALAARGRRCRHAWSDHRQRTEAAIQSAIAACDRRRTAVVLGSGPLGDVPIDALCDRFDRVVLVDAAHPPAARWRCRKIRNAILVTADLTGLSAGRDRPGCDLFRDDPDVDLTISANLLSQLPPIPLGMAADRLDGDGLEALGRTIVTAHLEHLRSLAGVKLLVTDILHLVRDRHGNIVETHDPLFGVALPPGPEWDWPICPPGELAVGRTLLARVRSVRL